MIYLLDEKDFNLQVKDGEFHTDLVLDSINLSCLLYKKLELASKTNELVYAQNLRVIGKTHMLIQFAKDYDYVVLTPNADSMRELYDYKELFSNNINQIRGIKNKNVVIDEGVTNIQVLKDMGFNIITGYHTISNNKINEISFREKVINNLILEADCLNEKIKVSREKHEFGTYKNLIQAYKEIINLYQDMCKNNVR